MVRHVCGLCDREALETFLTRWFLVIVSCPIAEIPRFCSRILPFYHEVFLGVCHGVSSKLQIAIKYVYFGALVLAEFVDVLRFWL